MSKLIVIIFALAILATILSDHSVRCQKSAQQIARSKIPCTCTLHGNNIITVRKQHSSEDGLYVCKKGDTLRKRSYRKRSGNSLQRLDLIMERLPVEQTVVRCQPGPVSDGQWTTGLCECCEDMGDCCFALWCLPVFACKTSRAAGGCVCLPLLDCMSCVPPASLAMRAAVRERYGIKGSPYSDCFYGCCCYPLSWCQISREIKRRAAALSNAQTSSHSSSSTKRWRVPILRLSNAHLV